ncbi:hypothetical protein GGR20_001349 [Devosia subaequoris]|uniref:Uncharacterized protein n=1 Tax=Devosia subaequoris TaxID=395930 RepID=A0A7W6ILD7_9HYPH|nr:hypothetical protein [Devosia subaequoris]
MVAERQVSGDHQIVAAAAMGWAPDSKRLAYVAYPVGTS